MMELLALYQPDSEARFPYGRFQFFLLAGTGLDQSEGHQKDSLVPWKEYWSTECEKQERNALAQFKGNRFQAKEHLHNHPAHRWYAFIEYQLNRDLFAKCLVNYRFYRPVPSTATSIEANRAVTTLLDELRVKLQNPEVIIDQIAKAKAEGRFDDGVDLYLRLRSLRPDYHVKTEGDRLPVNKEDDPLLEEFRERTIAVLAESENL